MNEFWIWGIALLLVALALLAWKKRDRITALFRKAPSTGVAVVEGSGVTPSALAQIVASAMATHARTLERSLETHVRQWGTAIRTDIAKATTAQSLAPAASDTASAPSPADGTQTASPVVPAAQALTESAAPSAVRQAPIAAPAASTEKAKVMTTARPFVPQSRAPAAIMMLHDFKAYAAAAQNFLDLPTVPEKFGFWHASQGLWPLQDYLGITANWINALSYDGLANGVGLAHTSFDKAANKLVVNGAPVDGPTLGWATADDQAPSYYKPLGHVNGSGADVVANFLRNSMQSSYLRGLGLTQEAIDAARA